LFFSNTEWGWRVSLGLAGVPALIITVGSLDLPDTPNSLIERGHNEQAKEILGKVRGTKDIHDEYNNMVVTSEDSKLIKSKWKDMLECYFELYLEMDYFENITQIL
jgi:MFS transporter, SP family, sugar:H+ symporter